MIRALKRRLDQDREDKGPGKRNGGIGFGHSPCLSTCADYPQAEAEAHENDLKQVRMEKMEKEKKIAIWRMKLTMESARKKQNEERMAQLLKTWKLNKCRNKRNRKRKLKQ